MTQMLHPFHGRPYGYKCAAERVRILEVEMCQVQICAPRNSGFSSASSRAPPSGALGSLKGVGFPTGLACPLLPTPSPCSC